MVQMARTCLRSRVRMVSTCLLVLAAAASGACDSEDTTEQREPRRLEKSKPQRDTPSPQDEPPQEPAKEAPPAAPLDATRIGELIGSKAKKTDDGVVKVTWSRSEVAVRVDGMPFPPAAGLTSWAGFAPSGDGAMLMGDSVVFQDEVSPAMDAAFAHDLEITALHNHFFFDEPKAYFMHIGGHGEPEKLARGVRAMWDAIRELREERAEPADRFEGDTPDPSAEGTLDAAAIGKVVGADPAEKPGGVVKVAFPREATMHDTGFGGSMGLSSWAAFTGSDELATIDGDFAMTAKEVQPVLQALREADIHVVALHNHMVGEEPAYYFTHFWGKGSARALAQGFRSALDAQQKATAPASP